MVRCGWRPGVDVSGERARGAEGWASAMMRTPETATRTVTCRRCGNVFGADSQLGISEVVGCTECLEETTKPKEQDNEQEGIAARN